jgi:hypothetical protein
MTMSRHNMLYIVLLVALAAVAALSYELYLATRPAPGVQINVGPGGVSIKEN